MGAKTANVTARLPVVAIVVFDGLSMFEFAAAHEVFGDSGGSRYDVRVCGPATITMNNGMRLDVRHRLSGLREAELVIVPPCDAPGGPPADVLRALRTVHARGARLASLCTGAFVLAAAGLLDGRRVTTHWMECDALAAQYPRVSVDPSVLYIDDGDILTSAGSAASIDLCLHIVRHDHGADAATAVARELVVPPYRDGGQAQFIQTPLPTLTAADLFAETMVWMRQHLGEVITVDDLAHRSAMSRRSFARRFTATTGTTPYQWLMRQRLQFAQQLLETGELSVDAVAHNSGFVNAANLRKHFGRSLHTTPHAYRRTFRTRVDA